MLKTLVKKQFREIFRNYFVNRKTGKPRSKGQIFGMFILFGVLMAVVAAMFLFYASLFSQFMEIGYNWLYYAVMSILTVILGTFGSVFSTYAMLYLPKDNELLLAMPIPPWKILLSRMVMVFGLSALYGIIAWAPTLIVAWIHHPAGILEIVYGLLLFPLMSLFVTVITCVLGWVVAAISSRMKNRSLVTVIVTFAFVGGYMYLSSNMGNFLQNILGSADKLENGIRTYGNLFWLIGRAGSGETVPLLLFAAICLIVAALCMLILSKSFLSVTSRTSATKTSAFAKKNAVSKKSGSVFGGLVKRELKMIGSSPIYMMNCALGVVFIPVAGVMLLIYREKIGGLLLAVDTVLPALSRFLQIVPFGVLAFFTTMNSLTAPSVSLEGKRLWILRSLPIATKDILSVKIRVHLVLTFIPVAFGLTAVLIVWKAAPLTAVMTVLSVLSFVVLFALFGMLLGIRNANLNWTTETVVVKGILTSVVIFSGWGAAFAATGLFWLFKDVLDVNVYLGIWTALFIAASVLIGRWIYTKGIDCVEELSA